MSKIKRKHEHEVHVEEFYTGSNHTVAVAVLVCKCGMKIWEELVMEDTE